jgi:hypothetical protein
MGRGQRKKRVQRCTRPFFLLFSTANRDVAGKRGGIYPPPPFSTRTDNKEGAQPLQQRITREKRVQKVRPRFPFVLSTANRDVAGKRGGFNPPPTFFDATQGGMSPPPLVSSTNGLPLPPHFRGQQEVKPSSHPFRREKGRARAPLFPTHSDPTRGRSVRPRMRTTRAGAKVRPPFLFCFVLDGLFCHPPPPLAATTPLHREHRVLSNF